MAKPMHPTPMLDALESGPWPSFVTGLKRLAERKDYVVDLMGQLETSYRTRKGYWKGGTVGVFGYGGGVISMNKGAALFDGVAISGTEAAVRVPLQRWVPEPMGVGGAGAVKDGGGGGLRCWLGSSGASSCWPKRRWRQWHR